MLPYISLPNPEVAALKKIPCLSPLLHLQHSSYTSDSQSAVLGTPEVPETLSESLQVQEDFIVGLGHRLPLHWADSWVGGAMTKGVKPLEP